MKRNLIRRGIVIVITVIVFTPFKVIMDGWRMPPPLPLGYIKENTKGKLNMANPDHKLMICIKLLAVKICPPIKIIQI